MDDFWNYLVNEIQNWSFRIEDIILHTFTGFIAGILIKFRQIIAKIRSVFVIKKKIQT